MDLLLTHLGYASPALRNMHSITKINYRYLLLSPRRWILRLLLISLAYFAFTRLMEIRMTSGTGMSLGNVLRLSKRVSTSSEGGRIKRDDWCTEAEYLDGEWLKRDEDVTLMRLREIYQYTVSPFGRLHPGAHVTRTRENSNAWLETFREVANPPKDIRITTCGSSKRRNTNGNQRAAVASTNGMPGTLPNFA